jgi:hypothetical protein
MLVQVGLHRLEVKPGLVSPVETVGVGTDSSPEVTAQLNPSVLEVVEGLVTEAVLVVAVDVAVTNVMEVERLGQVDRRRRKASQ